MSTERWEKRKYHRNSRRIRKKETLQHRSDQFKTPYSLTADSIENLKKSDSHDPSSSFWEDEYISDEEILTNFALVILNIATPREVYAFIVYFIISFLTSFNRAFVEDDDNEKVRILRSNDDYRSKNLLKLFKGLTDEKAPIETLKLYSPSNKTSEEKKRIVGYLVLALIRSSHNIDLEIHGWTLSNQEIEALIASLQVKHIKSLVINSCHLEFSNKEELSTLKESIANTEGLTINLDSNYIYIRNSIVDNNLKTSKHVERVNTIKSLKQKIPEPTAILPPVEKINSLISNSETIQRQENTISNNEDVSQINRTESSNQTSPLINMRETNIEKIAESKETELSPRISKKELKREDKIRKMIDDQISLIKAETKSGNFEREKIFNLPPSLLGKLELNMRKIINNNPEITHYSISYPILIYTERNKEVLQYFFRELKNSKYLTILELKDCNTDLYEEADFLALSEGLQLNTSLKELKLEGALSIEKLKFLAAGIRSNKNLEKLQIEYGMLDARYFQILIESLEETNIQSLALPFCELEFSNEADLAILENVIAHTKISSIDLSHNKLSNESLDAISNGLRTNNYITSINLKYNNISRWDKGIKSTIKNLLSAVKENTSLTSFSLAPFSFPDDEALELATYLSRNESFASHLQTIQQYLDEIKDCNLQEQENLITKISQEWLCLAKKGYPQMLSLVKETYLAIARKYLALQKPIEALEFLQQFSGDPDILLEFVDILMSLPSDALFLKEKESNKKWQVIFSLLNKLPQDKDVLSRKELVYLKLLNLSRKELLNSEISLFETTKLVPYNELIQLIKNKLTSIEAEVTKLEGFLHESGLFFSMFASIYFNKRGGREYWTIISTNFDRTAKMDKIQKLFGPSTKDYEKFNKSIFKEWKEYISLKRQKEVLEPEEMEIISLWEDIADIVKVSFEMPEKFEVKVPLFEKIFQKNSIYSKIIENDPKLSIYLLWFKDLLRAAIVEQSIPEIELTLNEYYKKRYQAPYDFSYSTLSSIFEAASKVVADKEKLVQEFKELVKSIPPTFSIETVYSLMNNEKIKALLKEHYGSGNILTVEQLIFSGEPEAKSNNSSGETKINLDSETLVTEFFNHLFVQNELLKQHESKISNIENKIGDDSNSKLPIQPEDWMGVTDNRYAFFRIAPKQAENIDCIKGKGCSTSLYLN